MAEPSQVFTNVNTVHQDPFGTAGNSIVRQLPLPVCRAPSLRSAPIMGYRRTGSATS